MAKPTLADKLVVAISSRALFDLAESHRIYTEAGVAAYHRYQVEHEDELLAPGPAFVVVADTWLPGWRLTVDGARAPLFSSPVSSASSSAPRSRTSATRCLSLPTSTRS